MPVFKSVLEVFQKEQPEYDVLVFRCLHRAPQPVGRQPEPVGEFEVAFTFSAAFFFFAITLPCRINRDSTEQPVFRGSNLKVRTAVTAVSCFIRQSPPFFLPKPLQRQPSLLPHFFSRRSHSARGRRLPITRIFSSARAAF